MASTIVRKSAVAVHDLLASAPLRSSVASTVPGPRQVEEGHPRTHERTLGRRRRRQHTPATAILRHHKLTRTRIFVLQRPHQLLGDIPIEAKLRTPATSLLYEICRVQKLDASDLGEFNQACSS
jgi:hypothetical protein